MPIGYIGAGYPDPSPHACVAVRFYYNGCCPQWPQTCCEDEFEPLTLLSTPPKCYEYRCMPPYWLRYVSYHHISKHSIWYSTTELDFKNYFEFCPWTHDPPISASPVAAITCLYHQVQGILFLNKWELQCTSQYFLLWVFVVIIPLSHWYLVK